MQCACIFILTRLAIIYTSFFLNKGTFASCLLLRAFFFPKKANLLRKQLPSDEGYGWDPSEVEAEKPCLGSTVVDVSTTGFDGVVVGVVSFRGMDGMDGAGRFPRFEPSEAIIGITEPLGYFDPLGFAKQGDFEGFLGGF